MRATRLNTTPSMRRSGTSKRCSFDETTGNPRLARDLFAVLVSIVDAYERGTRFHIGLDAADRHVNFGSALK